MEGHEILRLLNESIVDNKHRPYKDIRITHTVILEDPYADPRGFRPPSRSPSPSSERLKNGRIAADEDIDDTHGKTEAEIQEMLQEREAKARATILEIVGDIPDADVAPPENVLFVCKLNPVTTDDDLQIIFSRFGKIKTCEVIRDKKTNDSLQYAFIEFEEQKSCEDAYFKMDNVLIDDRRIHVDFSQSVSKIKWRGKGNYTIHDEADYFEEEKPTLRSKIVTKPLRMDSESNGKSRRRNIDDDRDWRRRSKSPRRRSKSPRRRTRSPRRRSSRPRYSPYKVRSPIRFRKSTSSPRVVTTLRESPPSRKPLLNIPPRRPRDLVGLPDQSPKPRRNSPPRPIRRSRSRRKSRSPRRRRDSRSRDRYKRSRKHRSRSTSRDKYRKKSSRRHRTSSTSSSSSSSDSSRDRKRSRK